MLLTAASPVDQLALAQSASSSQQGVATEPKAPKDPYQRSLQVYEFRKAAQSGPDRGQEIFYYKCWFCHNEFTKDIPKLTGLYQHTALMSGEPVTDDTVKEKIRMTPATPGSFVCDDISTSPTGGIICVANFSNRASASRRAAP